MDVTLATIVGLLLGCGFLLGFALLDTQRLLRVLRERHPEQYASLGRPGLFTGGGVVRLVWRPAPPVADDAVGMRLIRRLRVLHVLYTAAFVGLVALFLAAVQSSSR